MANAPSIFSASAITELIRLDGRAKLSYPTADSPHFRVERSAKLSKIQFAALAFNQPDGEFPAALLKAYQKVSEDAQWIQTVLRYETLPGLPLTQVANSWLDMIPPEFRVAESYTTTTTRVDPSLPTTPDAISDTILSSAVQMETAVEGTKTNVTRPAGAYPVLTGYEVNDSTLGEKAANIRTINSTAAPDQGFFIISSVSSPLGNGNYLHTTLEFQDPPDWPVLTQNSLGGLQFIPPEFRAALALSEVRTKVDAGASPDALSGTVLESVVVPETKYRSEKRTTSITGSYPTLTGHEADPGSLGVSAVVTKTLVADGTAPALGYQILTSSVQPLGNGLSISTSKSITWPVLVNQTLGDAGLIPPEFKALIGFTETVTHLDATTNPTPDALSSTVLQSSIEQQGHYLSVKRTLTLNSATGTLVGYEVSGETLGAIASVTKHLVTTGSGDTPATGLNIMDSVATPIGNGQSIVTTKAFGTGSPADSTHPTLTEKRLGGVDALPTEFRIAIELDETRTPCAPGTSPDALSGTVLQSFVVPIDKFRSEKRTSTLASGTFPTLASALLDEQTWGVAAAVTRNLYATGGGSDIPATGIGVLDSKVDVLGTGFSLVTTTSLAWPSGGLTEKRMGGVDALPPEFRIGAEFDTVRTKAAPTASLPALSSTVFESRLVPQTVDRSELWVTSVSGSLPTFTNHELNARGEVVAVSKSIVTTGTAIPSLTFHYTGLQQTSLGNGQDLLRAEQVSSFATFVDYQQTGGTSAAHLRKTTVSTADAGTALSSLSPAYPSTSAGTISDTIEQDNALRIVRKLVQIADAAGTVLTSSLPTYSEPLEYDKATRVQLWRDYKLVNPNTTTLPTLGAAWTGAVSGYVIDARIVPLSEAPYFGVNALQEVEYCEMPTPWVEFPMVGFEFPAIFKFAENYAIDVITAYYSGFPPPWPGDGVSPGTFQLIAHRQAIRQARRIHTYSLGSSNIFAPAFKVITPGVSSRVFQIPPNCVHQAINITCTSSGVTYQIEKIPASSPSGYSTMQILTQSCEERRVLGNIYEKIVTQISEDLPPDQFGVIFADAVFKATGQNGIGQQPDAAGETLWVSSGNSGDTSKLVRVYGRFGANLLRELVTLDGSNATTKVQTVNRFQRLYHLHVPSACVGAVSCYGSGVPQAAVCDFSAATIADSDTFEVGRAGVTQVYTFKTTMGASKDVQIVAGSQAGTLRNLVLAINGAGIAGTGATANYYTGTPAAANITATIDASDAEVIHFADSTLLEANTQTYTLTPTIATGTVTTYTFTSGDSANGPILCTLPAGQFDAYNDVFLSNPGLLTNAESIQPISGQVNEGATIVSASTDGTAAVTNNLPATVNLTSDWLQLPVPAAGGFFAYTLVACLAGTPSLTWSYDTSPNPFAGSPVINSHTPGNQKLGNGKVYFEPFSSATDSWVRVKINNSTTSNVARACHIGMQYIVPQ